MYVIRLPNGNLLVPESATAQDGRLVSDAYVEIGPDDEDYEKFAAGALTQEEMDERARTLARRRRAAAPPVPRLPRAGAGSNARRWPDTDRQRGSGSRKLASDAARCRLARQPSVGYYSGPRRSANGLASCQPPAGMSLTTPQETDMSKYIYLYRGPATPMSGLHAGAARRADGGLGSVDRQARHVAGRRRAPRSGRGRHWPTTAPALPLVTSTGTRSSRLTAWTRLRPSRTSTPS